ncbi:hypothetical protein D9758_007700 [Tetrapyrgos nigripes]|uniref:Uncharacterized protein n=1 Tax=Tetrapyrgos nigripes TaxID=182062 RepID=A0A8H5LII4_9AGAR|nr:hypothetical protein D9758_007700 [Tetrapyrgos nigripes]
MALSPITSGEEFNFSSEQTTLLIFLPCRMWKKLTICEGPFTHTPWVVNDATFRLLPYAQLPFTNLKELELGSFRARSSYEIDNASLSHFLKKNPMLETLTLIGISFNHLTEPLELLSSLEEHASFHTLGLISLLFKDPFGRFETTDFLSGRPADGHLSQPRLRALTFQNPDDRILDALFVQPNSVFDLSELEVLDLSTNLPTQDFEDEEERGQDSWIPACCRSSLVQLDLDIRDFLWTGVTFRDLSRYLQHLNRLERFGLKGLVLSHGWAHQISFIVTMIPALPASLRYITLRADIRFPALFDQLYKLDDALSDVPGCTNLKEIKVILGFRFSDSGEVHVEHVEHLFPKCKEKGLSIVVEKAKRRPHLC